jgi:hypothetical protein
VGGSQRTLVRPGPAKRTARASMSKTLTRRLDRLEESLLAPPGVVTKCWQVVYHYPEWPVNGPLLKWGPGYKDSDASIDRPRIESASDEEDV